ncbi:MAG: metallophosphoesterase [Clostridia bacterium]|nr:metallophosphoesterase [Clostridia bacterium]
MEETYKKRFTAKRALARVFQKKKYWNARFDIDAPFAPVMPETTFLEREKDKDFVILNLTDPHFADYDYRWHTATHVEKVAKELVEEVKPDLITVTGDMVCSGHDYFGLLRFIDLMESFSTPWAPVFGNHDDEGNCSQPYLAQQMSSAPHCLLKPGDPAYGVGNYPLCVRCDGENEFLIFMMDSHHGQMSEQQALWAAGEAEKVKALHTAFFMHIPTPEFEIVYKEAYDPEINKWADGYGAKGENLEPICCSHDFSGRPNGEKVWAILKSIPGFTHIFCGHDHLNNWTALYDGIRLTYTMKIGAGSGWRPWLDGGTVIRTNQDGVRTITQLQWTKDGIKPVW